MDGQPTKRQPQQQHPMVSQVSVEIRDDDDKLKLRGKATRPATVPEAKPEADQEPDVDVDVKRELRILHQRVKQQQELLDEQKQTIHDQTPIVRQSKAVRMDFFRRVLAIDFLLLALTLGLTYASVQTKAARHVMDTAPWVYLLVVALMIVIFLMYSYGHMDTWNYWNQVLVFALTVMTSTAFLCGITIWLDKPILLKASGLTLLLIMTLVIYTLNPWYDFSTGVAAVYILVVSLLAMTFFVYLPYQDFFNHPSINKIEHADADLVETGFLFLLAMAFTLYFVWSMHQVIETHGPKQYLYAAFRIFVDSVQIFAVVFRWAYKLMAVSNVTDLVDNATSMV